MRGYCWRSMFKSSTSGIQGTYNNFWSLHNQKNGWARKASKMDPLFFLPSVTSAALCKLSTSPFSLWPREAARGRSQSSSKNGRKSLLSSVPLWPICPCLWLSHNSNTTDTQVWTGDPWIRSQTAWPLGRAPRAFVCYLIWILGIDKRGVFL